MQLGGQRTIRSGETDEWKLWVIGDIHLGSRGCAVNRLRANINKIKQDPKALWIGLGDYADYIGYKDSRFEPEDLSEKITVADLGRLGSYFQDAFINEVAPIKDKCIGLLRGNHEDKYQQVTQTSRMHEETCNRLGVQDLGYSCYLDLLFKTRKNEYKYRIMAHHGAGYASTPGGKLNRLIRFMNDFPLADILIMGHVHQKLDFTRSIVAANADCSELMEINQLGVISGSYLRTYSKGPAIYGEKKGYSPVALGSAIINIGVADRSLSVGWA